MLSSTLKTDKWCCTCKRFYPDTECFIAGRHNGQPYYRCHGCARIRRNRYYAANSAKCYALNRQSDQRYPERFKARQMVYRALRAGILTRPEKCEHCCKTVKVQAHHDSYEAGQELVVRWLCTTCHASADNHII